MHEVLSVTLDPPMKEGESYERRDLFSLLLYGGYNAIVSEYEAIVSLVRWRSLESELLSPESALLHQLAFSLYCTTLL